ncbi:Hypothetical protein Tcol_2757 [Trichococcus collinsii]|uniref:Uncharacterized protein n=1 Tax=Trichococcus collinsii TaxID=157076 RepID=A0AB37ZZT3_9LACT|nr:Hypothetical protein Tcol_2757 [Trichococcus collinsii]SEA20462.1 hypothetical protein SAMN04488525_102244 [Trichococcus collinsii]
MRTKTNKAAQPAGRRSATPASALSSEFAEKTSLYSGERHLTGVHVKKKPELRRATPNRSSGGLTSQASWRFHPPRLNHQKNAQSADCAFSHISISLRAKLLWRFLQRGVLSPIVLLPSASCLLRWRRIRTACSTPIDPKAHIC